MSDEKLNFAEEFEKKWNEYQEQHSILPNIMILGRTGVGKSSLINRIFGKTLAPVSDIEPETQEFNEYRGDDYELAVNFIDSKGYEINDDAATTSESKYEFIKKVKNEIGRRANTEDSKIHILWYCISVPECRVEPIDTELIDVLSNLSETKNRLVVVLTKCDEDDEDGSGAAQMKEVIKRKTSVSVPMFEVSTDPKLPLELDKMIEWSVNSLDNQDLKDNFIASQRINLDEKKKRAAVYINTAAVSAATVGAAPITFSDSLLLGPIQIGMIVGIINTYGMQSLANISKQVISDTIISNLGKSVSGSLLKLIPGAGTIIGGAINATVAGSITKAIGEVCSMICYRACVDIMNGKNVDFDNLFDFQLIMNLVNSILSKEENSDE